MCFLKSFRSQKIRLTNKSTWHSRENSAFHSSRGLICKLPACEDDGGMKAWGLGSCTVLHFIEQCWCTAGEGLAYDIPGDSYEFYNFILPSHSHYNMCDEEQITCALPSSALLQLQWVLHRKVYFLFWYLSFYIWVLPCIEVLSECIYL